MQCGRTGLIMAVDLFGHEISEPRRLERKESAALAEVWQALRHHSLVSWVERMNSGVARIGGRFVRFGWPGCPDLLGQLRDGRLLGCEVKGTEGPAPTRTARLSGADQRGRRRGLRRPRLP
jgi:hypothetical protein